MALSAAIFGIVTLHVLPDPILVGSTGARVPYDPMLNFLSEYVRTQYGLLMSANFVLLAIAAGTLGLAVSRVALRDEARLLWGAAIFLVLLALLPTDLADFRTDGSTCHDPARVEPCTWVGRVHDVLPNFAFGFVALVGVSMSRRVEWRAIAKKGAWCAAAAALLVLAGHVYVSHRAPLVGRMWVGVSQRAVVAAVLLWMGMVVAELVRRSKLDQRARSASDNLGNAS